MSSPAVSLAPQFLRLAVRQAGLSVLYLEASVCAILAWGGLFWGNLQTMPGVVVVGAMAVILVSLARALSRRPFPIYARAPRFSATSRTS